ncbi:flavin reductase family protein [Pseudomonas sp. KNUC1026]|uniref:flavin reductase family protein n=1 Tax=Pseudomonas sp. KNUC1026 TaxID=2893890 RepID=UPI001F3ACB66|nr:flavin reductase family protein [Pseudomonas sp. KNUC1026]UFH50036.1 flavin reductase family protein [Pseudomonas sp. KNUC1026]
MSDAMHYYETATGHGLAHDPFKAIIAPRPIGWVSSCSPEGVLNLAPYSFFNAFADSPPIIGFSSLGRKDSLTNIERSGEFVWNLSTWALAQQMNQSSAPVEPKVSEFELAGLTPAASRQVKAPRVQESPVAFECKVSQIIQMQTAAGALLPNWIVLGEVVAVHIAKALIKEGVYDTAAAEPILRGGGPADYFRLGERFEMRRPQA